MIVITRLKTISPHALAGDTFEFASGDNKAEAQDAMIFMWEKDFEDYKIEKNGVEFKPSTYELYDAAIELSLFNNS